MFSFALRFPRVAEWRGWLPAAALPLFMFAALIALGGDRGYFYRDPNTHNWNTAKTLAIAENLSAEHGFRLMRRAWLNEDGGLEYDLYGRFPIGGFALLKPALMPFGDDLAAKLLAARVLMLLMFCGAALFAYLAISRVVGSRWIALAAALLAFSGFYAVYFADEVSNESVMDMFGAALVFHGMVVFVQEGRFRQLLVRTCAALLLGWHVYALILPFTVLGFGGEALALLRSAASSGEKAKAWRLAITSLARSRYAVLAVVALAFGSALLSFNFASEYAAYGGETPLTELPAFDSMMRRLAGTADYDGADLKWGNFISRQLYRAGVASVPYAVARAAGWHFPTPEGVEVAVAPIVLGAAAAVLALGGLALARGRRILMASAILFGFCWAILARHNAYAPYHNYEAVHYVWTALALFAFALAGARRLLGARLGDGGAVAVEVAACALAAALFALSVFHAGQRERDAAEAAWDKAIMADFSAIREITRGKRVASVPNHLHGYARQHYYLAGSRRDEIDPRACDPRVEDFAISRYRDESRNPLTPENRVAFLYESASPLELCRAERRRLEASEPAARGAFDVYLEDDRLSWLKAPCEPRDYEAAFFAYLYPVDANDLPARDRRNGYVKLMRWHTWFMDQVAAFDGACLLTAYLPDYPAAAIRAGQWVRGESRWDISALWEVSITPPLDAETLAFYENAYQATASSGDPAARTAFDLYLNRDRDTLSYLKEPCDESDTRGRFFLSVHPADVRDLPEDRREIGHESLNFTFAPPAGVVFNGKCMATRRLPDYDIARIETGQWIPGGERLWDGGIVVSD